MSEYFKNPLTIWIKRLCFSLYWEFKYRKKNLKIGYHSLVADCNFGNYNTLHQNVTLKNVELGDFTYVSSNSIIFHTRVGKFCCIGQRVECNLALHPSDTFVSVHPIFYSIKKQSQTTFADIDYFDEFQKVEIGNDVWVGNAAIIYGGVKIGDGAIIGAGALVTRDVPPYAIVGGMPARVLRYRFTQEQIDQLIDIKWWDKDVNWLKQNFKKMHNIARFLAYMHSDPDIA